MKKNNWSQIIDELDQLPKAAAPDFLFTRITQRINSGQQRVSRTISWSFIGAVSIWLGVQIMLVNKTNHNHGVSKNLIEAYELAPENTLYP